MMHASMIFEIWWFCRLDCIIRMQSASGLAMAGFSWSLLYPTLFGSSNGGATSSFSSRVYQCWVFHVGRTIIQNDMLSNSILTSTVAIKLKGEKISSMLAHGIWKAFDTIAPRSVFHKMNWETWVCKEEAMKSTAGWKIYLNFV